MDKPDDWFIDPDSGNIGIDGTLKLCEDLGLNPEDVVMLAVAYELKSPGVGEWTRQGWVDGWKNLEWVFSSPLYLIAALFMHPRC